MTAIYWRRRTPDKFGNYTFATPIEIRCRWENCAKEYRDPKGQRLLSSALVYVDRAMFVGDRLKLGELEGETAADAATDKAVFEVASFESLPNLRCRETLYTAYMGGKTSG